MLKILQGEVYLINFSPSFGHEYSKVRPAIVISSNELLKKSNLLTCLAVTSKNNNFIEGDVLLKKDAVNNLAFDSVIKMQHLSSFDKRRIHKYIGVADEATLREIKQKLKRQFDL
ncbi:MAG: type II toxin-antitoxin system PemK/MazF family toxin [Candidatus Gracilibacteria bacterium]